MGSDQVDLYPPPSRGRRVGARCSPVLQRDQEFERHRVWFNGLVAQAQARGFYGKLILTMEDGLIRRVVKEESLKPPVGD